MVIFTLLIKWSLEKYYFYISDLIVKIVKKVFDKDFDDFNKSKTYAIDDFLTYLGKANLMAVTEVNFR